jgi:mannose-6-phosphate isomerase-like protein (cupin superfamily)
MQAVLLEQLLRDRRRDRVHYREFLRVPALSAGLYTLPVGSVDPQTPHAEDEVYHVVQGRGVLQVESLEVAVVPGSLVHVPAGIPHRFHSITEELVALVWFAPAASSGAPGC